MAHNREEDVVDSNSAGAVVVAAVDTQEVVDSRNPDTLEWNAGMFDADTEAADNFAVAVDKAQVEDIVVALDDILLYCLESPLGLSAAYR